MTDRIDHFGSSVRRTSLLASTAVLICLAAAAQAQDAPQGNETEEFTTRIFVSNIDGTGLKPLADLPEIQSQGSPAWSKDGSMVAFDGWRPQKGENGQQGRIIVVNADGRNPRFFGDGAMPSFSPKGNRIAYSRYSKGVWVMNVNDPDEAPAQLDETGWGTDWSPDGTQIAYTRGYNTLMIFDLVEGTTVNLFDGRGPYNQIAWNFAWSPDGKKIAFRATLQNGKQGIVAVDTRGAKHGLDVLHEGTALPAVCWTTDSKQILFSEAVAERSNMRAIFGISATPGGKPEVMKGLPEDRQLMDPSISADGKKIAFSAYKRMPKVEK